MRTIREILDGNTVTPEERKRRREEIRERFFTEDPRVAPLVREANERAYGKRLGRWIAFWSAGD